MRTITEPPREIPVVAEADVVVCGGGPGGFPAAIAAARHGAKTILIERYGFMGGLATAGLVAPILGHTAHESNTPIVEGILREVTERMHALG
ncbi:MAG: FAD-dependent oxidoreductase, partial [Candidatus Latescibacterota bacterium]